MGGSLDLLSRTFPDLRLHFDRLGAMVGERDFGPLSQTISCALEGALFAACVVGAIIVAERNMNSVFTAETNRAKRRHETPVNLSGAWRHPCSWGKSRSELVRDRQATADRGSEVAGFR